MMSRQQPPYRRSHSSPVQPPDLYQQLLESSDLVKELDDIEAISQQISQHAEVLYQSWKNNGVSPGINGPGKFSLNAPASGSSAPTSPVPGATSSQQASLPNGGSHTSSTSNTFPRRGFNLDRGTEVTTSSPPHFRQNGDIENTHDQFTRSTPTTSTFPRAAANRLKPLSISTTSGGQSPSSMSGLSSPSFINSKSATLPAKSSSLTSTTDIYDKNPDVEKSLDLLATPEVNGSLKDLVNNFVSTDRAKQAARQTIANTINNMTKRNAGLRNNSPSTPSSSPFSSRGVSPLRSPGMLTNTNGPTSVASLTSLGGYTSNPGPLSPTGSTSSSSNASSIVTDISGARNRTQSPISESGRFQTQSPTTSLSLLSQNSVHSKMTPMFNTSNDNITARPWAPKNRDPIPIPVQHLGTSSKTSTDGLRSPGVLNTLRPASAGLNGSSTQEHQYGQVSSTALAPVRDSTDEADLGKAALPVANMHLAHVEQMRKRFEEAKQRMNMLHERALFGPSQFGRGGDDLDGPAGSMDDGHSSFLFDQFRRRVAAKNKQAALPHPELTPQQKQHIHERSVPNASSVPAQPLRRIGGSVADRVMMFERCPVFNANETFKDGRTIGSGGFPPGPLSNQHEKKKEMMPLVIAQNWQNSHITDSQGQQAKAVRDIPISKTGQPAPSFLSSTPSITTSSTSSLSSPLLLATSSPSITTTSTSVTPLSPSPSSRPTSQISISPSTSALSSRVPSPQPKSRPASLIITPKDKVLPKFHFPFGDPSASLSSEIPLSKFSEEFRKFKNSAVSVEELGGILKTCGYPMYWKKAVFLAIAGENSETLSYPQFAEFWRRMNASNHDESSQFMFILSKGKPGKKFLVPEDFVPIIQDIVDTHPGLGFLKEATEFHSRYVHTVIARIYFVVNRSWSGRITIPELRKSNFLQTVRVLEQEEDINQITNYFSYEHFYVIYCKFWELDKDHDLFIDREDLARHNDHAISTRIIDRIFSGAVTRGAAQKENKMSYTEFVWFLLAEEDKRSPTSIEYWFRCMDLDGDGYLSMYELEYFYEEQLQRMEQLGIETLPFEDCLCQMLDMIGPSERTKISLADLKNCRMTPIFFDTFFNLEKYLDHEQRDPFASQRDLDEDGNEMSDWDRFAAEEYELLVAEEGNGDGMDELCYDEMDPEMQLDQTLEKNPTYCETLVVGSS